MELLFNEVGISFWGPQKKQTVNAATEVTFFTIWRTENASSLLLVTFFKAVSLELQSRTELSKIDSHWPTFGVLDHKSFDLAQH